MTDRGYARISLDTQQSGSISKQVANIKKVASSDIEWYKDESVSGSKVPFAERPEGGRLMADLQKGDRVLITKIDRAARSVKDLLNLVERIEARGASIMFVDQAIDTSGSMGRFLLTLLGAIAELEASIIAERRRESLESFATEGRHAVGKAPFGFHSVPNPNGRGLVIRPHPEEGPLLRDAIARVMEGEPQNVVAKSIGVNTTQFSRLLRNPRLAGMTPDKGGVVMVDGVPRVDPDAALMGIADWSRMQRDLEKDKGWFKHEGIGPALSCYACGDRLYYQASKRNPDYATYKCRGVAPEHKEGNAVAASVMVKNAEAYVERVFLEANGKQRGMTTVVEDDSDARREAMALARVRLSEVRRRQDAAETDDEEEALMVQYLAAKRALREAEALPTTSRLVTKPTGRTLAEEWKDASPAARTLMLNVAGEWVVQPGRLPIEEKIVLRERVIDMEKVKAGLTPLS